MNDLLSDTSDEMLLALYTRGDRSAFSVLAKRYYERLYRFILCSTSSKDTAYTLTQATMLQLVRSAATFKHESRFSSWLFSIARSIALESYNESATKLTTSPDDQEGGHISLQEENYTQKRNLSLDAASRELRAIGQLSIEERDIFLLRHIGQVSYAEISSITGLRRDVVSHKMHAALEKLTTELSIPQNSTNSTEL